VTTTAEEWRSLSVAFSVIGVLVVAQVAGWLVYRSVHDEPTAFELTEKCLRREKLLAVDVTRNDPIAQTARGGALATRVEGNGVQVAIARSEEEAKQLAAAYMATGRKIELRLEVRGNVVYVWETPRRPSPTQRQTMYDCWYP
jgi:hypothetical protein